MCFPVCVFLLLRFKNYFYILDTSLLSDNVFSKYFLSVFGSPSYSLCVLHKAQVFNFNKVQHNCFFLSWIMILVLYLETHYQIQGYIDFFPVFSPGSFIVLHFTDRPVIHFGFIFVSSSVSRLIVLHVDIH